MKILYDYQALSMQKYGGISRYFYELVQGLKQLPGVSVDVIAKYSQNHYFESYFKVDKECHLPGFLRRGANIINRLYVLSCNRKAYDIIHPTYYHPYILNKFRGKMVITIHDMIYELFADQFENSKKVIEHKRKHIFAADKIICVSKHTKHDLLKIYPQINEDKIVVIYHGNSLERIDIQNKMLCIPALSIDITNMKYILFVGRRDFYKNFTGFIKATAPILQNDKELKIICAGGGGFNTVEKELISSYQILDRCYQINISDDILPYLYHFARCFVFPSIYEGFGIPILEAWACKCPIALSRASCFPEIAQDGGLYFNTDNEDEMRQVISSLVYNDELRNKLITRGLKLLDNYNWNKTVTETLDVYESIV